MIRAGDDRNADIGTCYTVTPIMKVAWEGCEEGPFIIASGRRCEVQENVSLAPSPRVVLFEVQKFQRYFFVRHKAIIGSRS